MSILMTFQIYPEIWCHSLLAIILLKTKTAISRLTCEMAVAIGFTFFLERLRRLGEVHLRWLCGLP